MGTNATVFPAALAIALLAPSAAAQLPWDGLDAEIVLTDVQGPIDIALEPDGSIWWNEYYTGNVNRYDAATGGREVKFHADPLERAVERGMVGLALDPDVEENGVFYVYYTVADPEDPDGGTNRLSRIADGEEQILLTLTAAPRHNGGRILFAPDGSMFVATGDNERNWPAQDPDSLLGKILHLWPDGTPAEGNVEGHVYSLGHRNVYGLAYDATTDALYATENGNAERDEVNLIRAGANYGWPHCEGFVRYDLENYTDTEEPCDDPRFTPPIGEFYPDRTAAPTGAAVVDGVLYWASWNEATIHRLVQDDDAGDWVDEVVFQASHRINDLEVGPDGRSLYFSNWTHVFRLGLDEAPEMPAGVGNEPQTSVPAIGVAAAVASLAAAARVARRR